MTNELTDDDALGGLKPLGDVKIATSHGIATIALTMALKYHQINTVQDGTLYQQYKLEGRNMRDLQLDMVFETAIQIEKHLLMSSDRIAALLIEAIAESENEGAGEEPRGAEAP